MWQYQMSISETTVKCYQSPLECLHVALERFKVQNHKILSQFAAENASITLVQCKSF